ncbi:hypothetical protein CAOG_07028 [Capsaspora owczarzaki ATCC 30864]|uniref:Rhodanese domain-containing protein n=1 Tax=Capsaspora owczarzaki (strain ATCC 30864) TaxID=595528 RepID=A0A0D2UP42_CAPO3|nr:hypothetical protein CAOG_07028 [Capsaspora owczarzaki ATCC 30864]KJE96756.1 hypothetical protein CAOG_007028 [Capsaspora owczarzaki ATCC 30864]|eukprot:XP_004343752.2 hypothetical protein CAOG_07028 [Capsaspora owczarzaki ATCC 30864]
MLRFTAPKLASTISLALRRGYPAGAQFIAQVNAAKSKVKEVTIDQFNADQKKAIAAGAKPSLLIDVREDAEWTASRIPGAIHLGKGIIERDIEATVPDTKANLVLYCGGGFRSALAAKALQDMGYTSVSSLIGGIGEWRSKGLPLDNSPGNK